MTLPSVAEMERYIRKSAIARGIDPDIAVRVARSEGLQEGTWQGNSQLGYGRERSYGPFQLHNAPEGARPGMGNDFVKETGLDPADTNNWDEGVDFALDRAKTGGWGPWYGAKNAGILGMMGIEGKPVLGPIDQQKREQRGKFDTYEMPTTVNQSPIEEPKNPMDMMGILASMMSSGGQQPTVAPAPAPGIQAGRYEASGPAQDYYNMGQGADEESFEDKIKRLMGQ